MPFFSYKAKSKDDVVSTGRVEAANMDIATELLGRQGLVVLSLRAQRKIFFMEWWLRLSAPVTIKDLVAFFRQLATLIASGIPLVQSLDVLVKHTKNKHLRVVIEDIKSEVEGGNRFSHALHRHPEVFSDFVINLVRAGENAGQLDLVLEYITEKEERDYELWLKIRTSLTYPFIILVALAGIVVLMFFFILPRFIPLLEGLGSDLPALTRAFIWITTFLSEYRLVFFLAVVALAVGGYWAIKVLGGRRFWDRVILSLPVMGSINQGIFVVRFSQSLAVLLKGGVPLITSLRIVSQAVENEVYRSILNDAIKQVEDGNPLAGELEEHDEIPPMVSQLISTGEQTGKLTKILEQLSRFYAHEVAVQVELLVGLIEPLILVILGIGVGIVMSAILLPIYNMAISF